MSLTEWLSLWIQIPGGLRKLKPKPESPQKQLFPWLFTVLELDSRLGAKMLAFALSKFYSTHLDNWNPGPVESSSKWHSGLSIPDSNKSNLRLEDSGLLL